MNHTDEPAEAPAMQAALLRILLRHPGADPDEIDWSVALPLAERHRVLLRLIDAVAERGAPLPSPVEDAALSARGRARLAAAMAGRLEAILHRAGIPHAFLKLDMHFPDVGGDLDLLVGSAVPTVDAILRPNLPGTERRRGLGDHLARSVRFAPRVGAVLDVHCGRLGRFGQEARLPALILARVRTAAVDGTLCCRPTREDQLLALAVQRAGGRRPLRLCDIVWTLRATDAAGFDWRALTTSARSVGALPRLLAFLDGVERACRTMLARAPLPPRAPAFAVLAGPES